MSKTTTTAKRTHSSIFKRRFMIKVVIIFGSREPFWYYGDRNGQRSQWDKNTTWNVWMVFYFGNATKQMWRVSTAKKNQLLQITTCYCFSNTLSYHRTVKRTRLGLKTCKIKIFILSYSIDYYSSHIITIITYITIDHLRLVIIFRFYHV